MIVNSHNIEFGYELLSAVPYAYELHLQGKLSGTVSGQLSEPLYYFSSNHKINPEKRSWYNTEKARAASLPYIKIHKPELQPKNFPPYKEQFANDQFKWDKPTLCICNRANIEWEHSIINYFDEEILTWLFENLKDQYHIVYFPIMIPESIQDNLKPINVFDDISLANKYGVDVFTDIMGDHWNEIILKVFANCEHYITMNGGYSILASYFSGQNIIYSKRGIVETKEIKQGSFWRWYPNINNVQTLHVPDHSQLKEKVQALYIDKLPTANVIIRTSNRPNGFYNTIQSVLKQTYKNINIVVTCDDNKGLGYTQGFPCRIIKVKPVKQKKSKPDSEDYGKFFPANRYLDQAQRKIKGYIFILDDDDKFTDNEAIEKVMKQMLPEMLAIWKVNFNDGRILPDGSFGKKVTLYDVTGIGMCYHTDMIGLTDWSEWKRADYRTAANWPDENIIWINEILTGLQKNPGNGNRQDINYKTYVPMNLKAKNKVMFLRDKTEGDVHYRTGETAVLSKIVTQNLLYRNFVRLVDESQPEKVEKEQMPEKKTKEWKAVRRRRTKKNTLLDENN